MVILSQDFEKGHHVIPIFRFKFLVLHGCCDKVVGYDIEFSELLRGKLLTFNKTDELCLDRILVGLSIDHNI